MARHIKTLKPEVVPTIFTFKSKTTTEKSRRRSPRKRYLANDFEKSTKQMRTESSPTPSVMMQNTEDDVDDYVCENCDNLKSENIMLKEKIKVLEQEKERLASELRDKNIQIDSLSNRLFTYDNFSRDEKLFRSTTGIEVEKFQILYQYLDPGENCENIKYHEPTKEEEDENPDILSSPSFFMDFR